jgi:hypothetical protein
MDFWGFLLVTAGVYALFKIEGRLDDIRRELRKLNEDE